MRNRFKEHTRLRAFYRHLRGVLVFGGFTLNTVFWFVPILVLPVVKLLLPLPALRRGIARLLMTMGETWIALNSVILAKAGSIDWRATGVDALRRDNWYLVISNHQTWVDILVLQKIFNRRIPFLKFFIKQQLIWFPFLGIAWWALDMPFMKRYSARYLARNPHMKGKDFETTRKACEKFRHTPTSVINFVEGTRFSVEKRDRHKDPYRHLLRPRAGGFAVAMASMGEMFGSILDVTLVYPDGPAKFWDMCCGEHVEVLVNVQERPIEPWLTCGDYENDREWRRGVQAWLGEIWQEKDELIQQTLDSRESQ
jgi:1-acyl-sn-glycerol-3-phosphate acyltransferase